MLSLFPQLRRLGRHPPPDPPLHLAPDTSDPLLLSRLGRHPSPDPPPRTHSLRPPLAPPSGRRPPKKVQQHGAPLLVQDPPPSCSSALCSPPAALLALCFPSCGDFSKAPPPEAQDGLLEEGAVGEAGAAGLAVYSIQIPRLVNILIICLRDGFDPRESRSRN